MQLHKADLLRECIMLMDGLMSEWVEFNAPPDTI